MVQFQAVPITNMIPNADRQNEYWKIKLDELTAQEREEDLKRRAKQPKEYRKRNFDKMIAEEREKRRKWNTNWQKEYRKIKLD